MNYYLYGSEQAIMQENLNAIMRSFAAEEKENMVVLDGQDKDFNMDKVLEALNTVSLFSMDNKIVVVRNPSFLSVKKGRKGSGEKGNKEEDYVKLEAYLDDSSYFSTLILCMYEDSFALDKENSYHKLLMKKCKCFEAKPLDDKAFALLVKRDIKEMGINIEPRAIDVLINRLGNNVTNWKQEAVKLQTYGLRIKEKDVPYLIHRSLEDNAFELCNALMKKNLKRSLHIFYDLVELKTDLQQLIGLLDSNFRTFYQAAYLSRTMSREEISAEIGVSYNRLYYVLENKKYYSAKKALELMNSLAELDHKIKFDEIDPIIGFELFLYEAAS